MTLLAGNHCSETNSGLKLLLHLGTWVSSLSAHLPNSSLQKICWRRKRFGHVLYSNRLIGELILEARNRILDHSHPEGISAWISFFLLFVWFGLGFFLTLASYWQLSLRAPTIFSDHKNARVQMGDVFYSLLFRILSSVG